jgi:hypothetical protein
MWQTFRLFLPAFIIIAPFAAMLAAVLAVVFAPTPAWARGHNTSGHSLPHHRR